LKDDGEVVSWDSAGGSSAAAADRLAAGVSSITGNGNAFAALKDGEVVTWGDAVGRRVRGGSTEHDGARCLHQREEQGRRHGAHGGEGACGVTYVQVPAGDVHGGNLLDVLLPTGFGVAPFAEPSRGGAGGRGGASSSGDAATSCIFRPPTAPLPALVAAAVQSKVFGTVGGARATCGRWLGREWCRPTAQDGTPAARDHVDHAGASSGAASSSEDEVVLFPGLGPAPVTKPMTKPLAPAEPPPPEGWPPGDAAFGTYRGLEGGKERHPVTARGPPPRSGGGGCEAQTPKSWMGDPVPTATTATTATPMPMPMPMAPALGRPTSERVLRLEDLVGAWAIEGGSVVQVMTFYQGKEESFVAHINDPSGTIVSHPVSLASASEAYGGSRRRVALCGRLALDGVMWSAGRPSQLRWASLCSPEAQRQIWKRPRAHVQKDLKLRQLPGEPTPSPVADAAWGRAPPRRSQHKGRAAPAQAAASQETPPRSWLAHRGNQSLQRGLHDEAFSSRARPPSAWLAHPWGQSVHDEAESIVFV